MRAPDARALADRVWYGDGTGARVARIALAPLSLLYAVVGNVRNAAYDRGILARHVLPIPTVSVGNLTVGGTGKTPFAAWLAGELLRRGRRPAIVLRGYGDDEPAVHARLTPRAIVVANADRVAGVEEAARRGAEVAVLDDAFQHRRARRDADVVLVSADRWPARARTLPSGPFREPLGALRRAALVVITRKAADAAAALRVERRIREAVPGLDVAHAHLAPAALVDVASGASRDLGTIAGRPVLAICGVGDPDAFARQLTAAGARVSLRAFPDHHPFADADVAGLVDAATEVARAGGIVVCTLKDAVKLGPRWPAAAPALSFVSQQVILEAGQEALDRLLTSVLHAPPT